MEVVAEKPASSAGLLPLLLIPIILCVALCGGNDDTEVKLKAVTVLRPQAELPAMAGNLVCPGHDSFQGRCKVAPAASSPIHRVCRLERPLWRKHHDQRAETVTVGTLNLAFV
jgi:hypothetical protein